VSPAPAHAQRGFPSRPMITSMLMVPVVSLIGVHPRIQLR
jgi:hypothetical protein